MGKVVVDIDHCLSDAAYRDPLLGQWDAYHSASEKDLPIHAIVLLVNMFHNEGYTVVANTARPEKWRQLTVEWLLRHGINVDEILMRPDGDYSATAQLKIRQIENIKDQVLLALDDRDDVIAGYRALGLITLQVRV